MIPDNESIATGMESKELSQTADIFWSREPITGPKGTKENPAIIPSFNDHRVVGLEIEQARGARARGWPVGCVRSVYTGRCALFAAWQPRHGPHAASPIDRRA